MESFKDYYRAIYRNFGYPLTAKMALTPKALAAAEESVGKNIPASLRDYYLVAGRETRFNKSFNKLLPPAEWEIDQQRLIFMAENQGVCWWGVSIRNPDSIDPPVSRGFNSYDEPISWHHEHRKCSVFLAVMLHYHAVNGGFEFTVRTEAQDDPTRQLEESGWTYYGEVASLRAWSRANRVVCLTPPGDLPFMQKWTIDAGGKTQADLDSIGKELGVEAQE